MLHVFVTFIFTDDEVELFPIQKRHKLSENLFILTHLQISLRTAKLQIEIRLFEKYL